MAAFTPTGIKIGQGAVTSSTNASEAITAGQAVTQGGYIVDPDSATGSLHQIAGLAVQDSTATGQVIFVHSGELIVTNTLSPQRQIIAAPSGQLQYDDDLLSGDAYVIVGYTKDANTIVVLPKRTYVTKS